MFHQTYLQGRTGKETCLLLYFPFLSQTLFTYRAVLLKLLSLKRVQFPVQFLQIWHKILSVLLTESAWKRQVNILVNQEGKKS